MSFLSTSPAVGLGYLNPSPLSKTSNLNVELPRNLGSPATFSMNPDTLVSGSQTNVLDNLAEINAHPKFYSTGEVRQDTIMERLLRNGYLVKSRVYSGSQIAYFLARIRCGDCLFIKIDSPEYIETFPSVELAGLDDIQLSKSSVVTVLPQETKISALECLDLDICGAAFICNGSVCMTEHGKNRNPKLTNFTEENFVFNSTRNIAAGMIGNSVMSYPIVSLVAILNNPREMELKIGKANAELTKMTYLRIEKCQAELHEAVQRLNLKVVELDRFKSIVMNNLNSDIGKVDLAYQQVAGLSSETLSDSARETYDTILKSISRKKELRSQSLARLGDVQSLSKMIESISNEIDSIMNPVVNDVLVNLGRV